MQYWVRLKYNVILYLLLLTSALLQGFRSSNPPKKIFLDFYKGMTEKEYQVVEKKLIIQWQLSKIDKRTYFIYQDRNNRPLAYGFLDPVFDLGKLIGIALLINDENNTGRIGDCYPLYDFTTIENVKRYFSTRYGSPKYREGKNPDGTIYNQYGWQNIVLNYYSINDKYGKTICCQVYYY